MPTLAARRSGPDGRAVPDQVVEMLDQATGQAEIATLRRVVPRLVDRWGPGWDRAGRRLQAHPARPGPGYQRRRWVVGAPGKEESAGHSHPGQKPALGRGRPTLTATGGRAAGDPRRPGPPAPQEPQPWFGWHDAGDQDRSACPAQEDRHRRAVLDSRVRVSADQPARPSAALGEISRSHQRIENRFHWVRDTAYDEDRYTARTGSRPVVLACLRNTAISSIASSTPIASASGYVLGFVMLIGRSVRSRLANSWVVTAPC